MTGDGDAAARRVDDAADDADQRRLAGAVRAQQGENFTFVDAKIDAFQRLKAIVIGLCKVLDINNWLHRRNVVSQYVNWKT